MRILIANWRDIHNPHSGGAEILTHEMAKRWVAAGHCVTQFSATFNKAKKREVIDGVTIVRSGSSIPRFSSLPVHVYFFIFALKNQKKFDIVVDEVHGIPFFTQLYIRLPIVLLVCEVADTIWDVLFTFPFNKIGKFIERQYLRLYPQAQILTISPSTKSDIVSLGVSENRITILPMGITRPQGTLAVKKEKNLTLIFIARMSKAKGVEDALVVLEHVRKKHPHACLWIIGRTQPSYLVKLKEFVKGKNLTKSVIFYGYVTQKKKFEFLKRAHVLIVPSHREGFGLTVPEAGSVGTPSVVYDVPGLRDLVVDEKNGRIVPIQPNRMAEAVHTIVSDKRTYARYQKLARSYATQFTWDKTAQKSLDVLTQSFSQ